MLLLIILDSDNFVFANNKNFDFKGWQKWNAWTAVSELSSDEAKTQYIALVQKIYDELI